jgi:innexin
MHHSNIGSHGTEVRHNYYQWVTLALIAQAAITHLPTFLWKVWEGGRIKSLVTGLHHPCLPLETRESSKRIIMQFLLRGAHHQGFYLFRFMICDLLNLAVVIGQFYFINYMVGDIFTKHGFDMIKV